MRIKNKMGRPPPSWFAELTKLPKDEFFTAAQLAAFLDRDTRTVVQGLQKQNVHPTMRRFDRWQATFYRTELVELSKWYSENYQNRT